MIEKDKNLWLLWKRRATRILAAFFVLYALADVTVLQTYCGNETVGIPPYAQQLRAQKQSAETTNTETAFKTLDSSSQEQTPDLPDSEESCFCCCSHVLLGFDLVKPHTPKLASKVSHSNFSFENSQSDSHLRLQYLPPKSA